ncbi:PaeR7I family type II restriction endonuclease [Streptomyces bluensis]|uniref:PaeR7I family type II restriction endonuclease n=1 Tax=Streptomyces bluensis TaxID=33897 RepID=UPI00333104BD
MDSNTHIGLERALRSWGDVRYAQAARAAKGGNAQEGSRSAVTGGKHLDGIDLLVREELKAAGGTSLEFRTGRGATVPGYYRPTKAWDLLVLQDGQPVLAVEYKSMKGSEGKNLNNRADEVFGVAEDLRQAEERKLLPRTMRRAYVFVMGMTDESTAAVGAPRVAAGEMDTVFTGASYFERAAIMCERMQETGLYHFAWAVGIREDPFGWSEPRDAVNWENFSRGLRGMFAGGKVKPLPPSRV